jgi:hypothetical protein
MRRAVACIVAITALAGCDAILGIQSHELASGGAVEAGADGESEAGEECEAGALRCAGNTPESCNGGVWQAVAQTCGGSTPVCSNGACRAYLVTGGIRTTGVSPSADGGIRVVSGGFEFGARSCSDAGLCVTGGIVP